MGRSYWLDFFDPVIWLVDRVLEKYECKLGCDWL